MTILTLVYGGSIGTAKIKRARRGMERDWNRFGDPQKRFWRGNWHKRRWLQHRQKKFEKDVDNLKRVWHNASVT